MKTLLSLLVILLQAGALVPTPSSYTGQDGKFHIPGSWSYTISADLDTEICSIQDWLDSEGRFSAATKKKDASLSLCVGKKYCRGLEIGEEGYFLDVSSKGVKIKALKEKGAFYALQTLVQLAELNENNLPYGQITDSPKYPWRGIMIDVSRHFRSVEFICKQIDAMALLKLNRLHFHLVDEPGWRIELRSHPELVQKASFRRELAYKPGGATLIDVPPAYQPGTVVDEPGCYGGYYTREQLVYMADYAAKRGITIVPEIEMPGHNTELFEVHRELFCSADSAVKDNSVCPGKESTLLFFEEILDEVMEIFPSEFIHIGGDEARKTNWSLCPDCQRKMTNEGLKDLDELQASFIRSVAAFVSSRGRRIIGWDEIIDGGLPEGAVVMSWRDPRSGLQAMEEGYDIIFSPAKWLYLDYYQNAPQWEPKAIGGYTPLEKVWSFPMPVHPHALGVQGNLWSEYIVTDGHCEYMLYPRALAVAELGWSGNCGDYASFREKARQLCQVLFAKGYNCFDLDNERLPDPVQISKVSDIQCISRDKSYVCSGLVERQSPSNIARYLTNGRCTGTLRFRGEGSVVIDLESEQDIHCVCPYFLSQRNNRGAHPSEVCVSLSDDGITWREAGICRPMLSDASLSFAMLPMPLFLQDRARYVKIVFAPSVSTHYLGLVRGEGPGQLCEETALSEIVVN